MKNHRKPLKTRCTVVSNVGATRHWDEGASKFDECCDSHNKWSDRWH